MTENGKELRDIFPAEPDQEESEPLETLSDSIEQGLKRQRLYNFLTGLLAGALLVIVLFAAGMEYFHRRPESAPPPSRKNPYVAGYTLPVREQWALDYRQTAMADGAYSEGAKPLSTKWVKNAAYHLIMGEEALNQNNIDAAETHLTEALKIFPDLQDARRALGAAYLKQQNFNEAVPVLEEAAANDQTLDVMVNLGAAYIGAEQYEDAEEILQKALREYPDVAGVHRNLGLLYQKTHRTEESIAHFKSYFQLEPNDTDLAGQYASFLQSLDRTPEAIRFLEQMQSEDSLQVHLLLARISAEAGNVKSAVEALKRAAHHLSPNQTLSEINNESFDRVRHLDAFEELTRELELAAVSLAPGKDFIDQNDIN